MKRLLVVTLLLLGISAFVSCNSYDVEGKPEIASNPAKMVFAYYPWDDGSSTNTDPTTEPTTEPTETPDTETPDTETPDTEEPDTENPDTEEPDTENPDTEEPDTENPDTEIPEEDSDTENPDEDSTAAVEEGNVVYVVKATLPDTVTEEFEIYNRGITGELKIRKINLLDPDENLIASSEDETYKKLFQIQVQNVNEKGIVTDGYGAKGLTFDYMKENKNEAIASLCPRKEDGTCKEGFKEDKYNSKFKILLSYDKAAATTLKDHPSIYRESGEFSIEICTNDPGKDSSTTCGEGSTSYRIQVTRQPNKPPKPIIHVAFRSAITKPMSYRNIKDYVEMDLSKTCVSNPDAPEECLPGCDEQDKNIWTGANCNDEELKNNWKQRYYIRYKWEMTETPTPLLDDSKLQLENGGSAGQWLSDDGIKDRPVRAKFKGLMITPRRYSGENNKDYNTEKCASCGDEPVFDPANPDNYLFLKLSDYLICRQKYCEDTATKYYKVNIQAETVDKATDLVSETADITVVPKIIPQARVVAQLSYKQGYRTKAEMEANKDGVTVDLDIHMIKKTSIEAADRFDVKEGLLGTVKRTADMDGCLVTEPNCEKYWRHDDCSFGDPGEEHPLPEDIGRTIQWYATLDIDNTWGGNNYETPETIGLGPIEDELDNATGQKTEDSDKDGRADGDGIPDVQVEDDQYLIVVGYVNCQSNYSEGGDRCDPAYTGEDKAYEVDAQVEIRIDGDEAGKRKNAADRPDDSYAESTKNFKIKVNEWKVLAVVKWDNSLASPESNKSYPGNAIVTDKAMTTEGITIDPVSHPLCTYDNSDAVLIPIWDADTYKSYIETPYDSTGDGTADKSIGSCN